MIDWTKKIQTKDGKPARLLGELDTGSPFKKVVAVRINAPGMISHENSCVYMENGHYYADHPDHDVDLENIPETVTMDILLLEVSNDRYVVRFGKEKNYGGKTIARKTVTFTIGEGL